INEITTQGNTGEISFNESIVKRVEIIQPSQEDMVWLSNYYVDHRTDGLQEVVKFLHEKGISIHLISGSFKDALYGLQEVLGLDEKYVHANELIFDESGKYAGFDPTQLLANNNGKAKVIQMLNLDPTCIFVGDGYTDMEVKGVVDLFVGFGGVVERSIVKANADRYIYDLTDMIELVQD
ncbi:HAD-IB family phosphatase, partial [candidate division WWE3 bacterium]|nr:HAD-IB family phosphatase [candidate division WWE3 bacterium]